MDMRKEKRTANFRSKPTKQPAVMVVPEREIPGQVAMAWPDAHQQRIQHWWRSFRVLRPFRTRSLAKSRQPVTSSAPADEVHVVRQALHHILDRQHQQTAAACPQ